MIVVESRTEVRRILDKHRADGASVGFVGTSGGTHDGHLSLAQAARHNDDVVVVFWNGALNIDWAGDTLQVYSRDYEHDATQLESAGVDLLFVTRQHDLYRRPPVTFVEMPAMAEHLRGMPEGQHMNVVVTMVLTLLNIAGPCTAYFGEKDWPQLVMFQRMAEDLMLPSKVVAVPTIRDDDGVAVSGRNARLSPADRARAPELYQALTAAVEAVRAGERDGQAVAGIVRERLRAVADLDYVAVVEADTLRPLDVLVGDVRLLASARFGTTSLIDNVGVSVPFAEAVTH
jgi:pantoate--beta-alanine ligase